MATVPARSAHAATLGLADEQLIQRVVSHVLVAARDGELPCLAWDLGLSGPELQSIGTRWPLSSALWQDLALGTTPAAPHELLAPLRDMLLARRAEEAAPLLTVLANALSCACFGPRHLWQDLGATGRGEVSRLLEVGFPALFRSNVRDLRWKRHLFLQLGEQLGRDGLWPPKCNGCDDYDVCFGADVTAPRKTWPLTPPH